VISTDLAGNSTQISNLHVSDTPISMASLGSAETASSAVAPSSAAANNSSGAGEVGLHPDLHKDGTFVFHPAAIVHTGATDLTQVGELWDRSSGAAPPHPGIDDQFTAGHTGPLPTGLPAGADADIGAFAAHHPTDFHLV